MSAYANVARALGRRGARLGRARDDLHRDARAAIDVDLGGEPRAARRLGGRRLDRARERASTGRPRAEFLAELVAAQPSIVVARRARQDDDRRR